MAINKNHEFEELDGIKCSIVEKNATAKRVEFLKRILVFNKFQVVVVASPPPKVAAKPASAEGVENTPEAENQMATDSFTIGVSDYTFNVTNALYGRLLKTPKGSIVTPAYWNELEAESHDEIPYYEPRN